MGAMSAKNLDAVFAALPTAFVILKPDRSSFEVEEVNRAFLELSGRAREDLLGNPFFAVIKDHISDRFEENIDEIEALVRQVLDEKKAQESGIYQLHLNDRSKSATHKNQYLQFKCSPVFHDETVGSLVLTVEDVTDLLTKQEKNSSKTQRISRREELHSYTENLVARAKKSEAKFESASQELDDFVYSVSHDLRAPLRRIDGFSQELLNEYADKFDEMGAHYLKRIRQGAQDMGQLIDDLLKLSRISRKSVEKEEFDLGEMAKTIFDELMELEPEREVDLKIDDNLKVEADKGLVKAMLGNLISNALKFSSKKKIAEIEIGSKLIDGDKVFYISDNGVGFDSAYSQKLFKAFSRLHSHNQFSGTGIGLATVKRIMILHGGTIWAESPEGEGATFYFKF